MTGRQKIEAALSSAGTPEIGAVVPYEDIFVRDHWDQLTPCPWWYQHAPDIERQVEWRRDAIARTGQDWFYLPLCRSRDEREGLIIEASDVEAVLCDRRIGKAERITKPLVGGWNPSARVESYRPARPPVSFEEVDAAIRCPSVVDPRAALEDGSGDLAAAMMEEFGGDLCPVSHVSGPLWSCYSV